MISRAPAPNSTSSGPASASGPAPGRSSAGDASADGGSAVAPWQRALAEAVTDPEELLGLLGLDPERLPGGAAGARRAAALFGLRVPRGYVGRMRPGDPDDPLLRQVLPLGVEAEPAVGFTTDPLAEAAATAEPGVLRKYRGRALLVVTGACAIHCRYCFRRHFPYGENRPGASAAAAIAGAGGRRDGRAGWGAALDALAADPTVEEVILSGGDPLAVSDERLEELARGIAAIPHVRRLRVHSRNPIVLPERIDDRLLAWLAPPAGSGRGGPSRRLDPVVVVHANHAREIDGAVAEALDRLRAAGVTVLNQSVLLAGVNDSVEALEELSRALFAAGVLPYYLHLLDRVAGAAQFEVPEARARSLVGELAARLSGYLVPKLVREVPGAPAKVPVAPLLPAAAGRAHSDR